MRVVLSTDTCFKHIGSVWLRSPWLLPNLAHPLQFIFPLLSLPLEVRIMIYKWALVPPIHTKGLPLLLTCWQIYAEAHILAFSSAAFRQTERSLTRLKKLRPEQVNAMTSRIRDI